MNWNYEHFLIGKPIAAYQAAISIQWSKLWYYSIDVWIYTFDVQCLNSTMMNDLSLFYRSRWTTHFNFTSRNQDSAGISYQMSPQYYNLIDTYHSIGLCISISLPSIQFRVSRLYSDVLNVLYFTRSRRTKRFNWKKSRALQAQAFKCHTNIISWLIKI